MSEEPEEVVDKIDRLNSVIYQLMNDLSTSRCHSSKISVMSSMQSICENNEELEEIDSENSLDIHDLQERYEDKLIELCTEIDRLGMIIEDLIAEKIQKQNSTIEILLTMGQLANLNEYLSNIIKSHNENAIFSLNKNSLVSGNLSLISQDFFQKLSELEIENINLQSKLLVHSVENSKKCEKNEINIKVSNELIDYELMQMEFSKKEQELYKIQEELRYKTTEAEIIINEYTNKLEEIKNNEENSKKKHIYHKRCPSQDITRMRTPISMLYPYSNLLASGAIVNQEEIESKIKYIEELIKKKLFRKKKTKEVKEVQTPDIVIAFKERETEFKIKLEQLGNFSKKEKFILSYLNEESSHLLEKINEIKNYEAFLQETWVGKNGESSGIDAIKNACSKNFERMHELSIERENFNHKRLRFQKIRETINAETNKLKENRKKILTERHKLSKQQQDITNFLKNFKSINKIIDI